MHLIFFLAGFPLARAIAGQAAATQGPTAILARAERAISHGARGISRSIQSSLPRRRDRLPHVCGRCGAADVTRFRSAFEDFFDRLDDRSGSVLLAEMLE